MPVPTIRSHDDRTHSTSWIPYVPGHFQIITNVPEKIDGHCDQYRDSAIGALKEAVRVAGAGAIITGGSFKVLEDYPMAQKWVSIFAGGTVLMVTAFTIGSAPDDWARYNRCKKGDIPVEHYSADLYPVIDSKWVVRPEGVEEEKTKFIRIPDGVGQGAGWFVAGRVILSRLMLLRPDLATAAMAVGMMPSDQPVTCFESRYNCRTTHRVADEL